MPDRFGRQWILEVRQDQETTGRIEVVGTVEAIERFIKTLQTAVVGGPRCAVDFPEPLRTRVDVLPPKDEGDADAEQG